ncbi:MAG: NAD(P)/FAD-dependent oxidoreductase [Halodesulfurarchaeum sp.]
MTVGVIGAGISGLALTHYLTERGIETITFEAEAEPGGIIKSREVEGTVLELGPQRLRLTPPVREFVETFDLESELYEGNTDQPLYVYTDGAFEVAPLSLEEAITTDLLSWPAKLRILAEPLTTGPIHGETVEEFLTRKFGSEAARKYFGPLYTGLYGTSADDMLVEYSLGRALSRHGIERSLLLAVAKYVLEGRDPPPIVTFEEGMQRLPEAMTDRYDEHVHLDEPVRAVRDDGDGYVLETSDRRVDVEAVGITTPAGTAADIVEPTDSKMAGTLRRFNYNPLAIVHLKSTFGKVGHGCQILPEEGFKTNGMTWNASMLDRDGVYTSYIGESEEFVAETDPATLGSIAAEEFETITGAEASVLNVHKWLPGMPAYDRSWLAMRDLHPPEGIELVTNYTERAGIIGRITDAREGAARIADAVD